MTYSSFRVKVPGKLLIGGEYAVLEANQPAIVMAVNRYMTAYIEPSRQNGISLPQLGFDYLTWKWRNDSVQFDHIDSRLAFIDNSISIASQFLQEKSIPLKPVHITVNSELYDATSGKKLGFGSSAAVVVAVISAMLTIHRHRFFEPTLEELFKLSAIAHLRTQKNGSGADLAAAVFGGWLRYTAFDSKWLLREIQNQTSLDELVKKPWPNLSVLPIQPPENLNLCIGWTNMASLTGPKIKHVQDFRDRAPGVYAEFLNESAKAVERLLKSFERNDVIEAIAGLKQNRRALSLLDKKNAISIETGRLKDLCTIAEKYGSGKSSGAGGGDCGIAFLDGGKHTEELYQSWKQAGIIPLPYVTVSQLGAFVIEYNCETSVKEYLRS